MSPYDPRPAVLLVEDEALVRLTLGEMLEDSGFRVLSVASAEEALEVLGHVPNISALVTDVEITPGGMNGFELALKAGEEYGLPAVVLPGERVLGSMTSPLVCTSLRSRCTKPPWLV